MMNNVQLELNRELLTINLFRLQAEILIEEGMALTSPELIEINNEIDKHSLRAIKMKQYLNNKKKRLIFRLTV